MLFVAEYELSWETLEAAVAKRIEWGELQPEGFHFIGEYVWPDGDPPFRGIAIIDADSVETLNSFVLNDGETVKMRVHPASDLATGVEMVAGRAAKRRGRNDVRRRSSGEGVKSGPEHRHTGTPAHRNHELMSCLRF